MRKTMVICADSHCGHVAGLTPLSWCIGDDEGSLARKSVWEWYEKKTKEIGKPDILVWNGDAIDGRGEKSGGTELLVADRNKQVEMAVQCAEIWKAKKVRVVRGTAYHVGDKEDFEDNFAKALKAEITDHDFFSVEFGGRELIFDCKHHIGGSSVPHGRHTALSRDKLWNLLWAESEDQPKSDWTIRSHVHYCVGNFEYYGSRQKWGLITPALQLANFQLGTKFGARRVSGTVQFGFVVFRFFDNGEYTWRVETLSIARPKSDIPKL
jgi:hypothetical protein